MSLVTRGVVRVARWPTALVWQRYRTAAVDVGIAKYCIITGVCVGREVVWVKRQLARARTCVVDGTCYLTTALRWCAPLPPPSHLLRERVYQ